jgi:hypothetical protein
MVIQLEHSGERTRTWLKAAGLTIAIAGDFGAHYDFVPMWTPDRVFYADTWPRDGEGPEAVLDIRRNWNAYIDSRGDTNREYMG